MIRVYHSRFSRSTRVIWALEELGVPYDIEPVKFSREVLDAPAFRALSPAGRVPVLTDTDLVMIESGAIVQYLLETHGNGRLEPPPRTPLRPRYLQWFHFSEGTALPPLSDLAQHSRIRPEAERIPAMVADAQRRGQAIMKIVDDALGEQPYIVGDAFTAADIMLGYAMVLGEFLGVLNPAHPRALAYLARLKERPGLQKALTV